MLEVLRRAEQSEYVRSRSDIEHPQRWWMVKCDCGKTKAIRAYTLQNGDSQSCGCRVEKTRATIGERTKLPIGEAAKWAAYVTSIAWLRRRNKTRKNGPLVWALSLEQFLQITSSPCHYCGIAWSKNFPNRKDTGKTNGNYKHNGIDRLDNRVGYIPSNCVPCCMTCNTAKAQMTVSEFRAWVERVHATFQAKDAVVK